MNKWWTHWSSQLAPGNQLLLSIAAPNAGWIAATIGLNFLSGLFNGASVALLVPAILAFFNQSKSFGEAPGVVRAILEGFDRIPGTNRFVVAIGAIVVAIIIKNVLGFVGTAVGGHLSRSLVNGATFRGLKLLLEVGVDYYTKVKAGEIVQRIGSEMSGAVGTINTIVQISATLLTMSTFVAALVSISWQLTLVAGAFALLIVLANRSFSRSAKELGYRGVLFNREYASALMEMIAGIRLIKASSTEPLEYDRLAKTILKKQRNDLESQALSALAGSTNELLAVLSLLAIVAVGWWLFADRPSLYVAILLTYLFLLSRVLGFVTTLGKALNNLSLCAAAVDSMVGFLDRRRKHFVANGAQVFRGLQRAICFEDVSFYYPGQERSPVLNGVSFELPKGKTLALVGSSGSGKSTIADLLVRFYDPTGGRITLDGVDLREYDLATVHRRLGLVSQDTFLFNDTVYGNIAYGCPDVGREQVLQAAEQANALEFIERLPEGFETKLGDRGVRLSGGQQQRIAIARALLRDPDILVLDEATSALDTVSERLVQAAIDEISHHRTVLMIAHRLSTVQNADCIVVLDGGQKVEAGTHSALLAAGGRYAQLYAMQFAQTAPSEAVQCSNTLEPIVIHEVQVQMAAAVQRGQTIALDPSDIAAYALNRLPPLYATTQAGARFQQNRALQQWDHAISERVAEALEQLKQRPEAEDDRLSPVDEQLGWSAAVVRRLSFDVRSRLNVLLGAIDLLEDAEDDYDSYGSLDYRPYYRPSNSESERIGFLQERYDAAKQAYTSAMEILSTLELLETTMRASHRTTSALAAQSIHTLTDQIEPLAAASETLAQRLLDRLLTNPDKSEISGLDPLYEEIRHLSLGLIESMGALEAATGQAQ